MNVRRWWSTGQGLRHATCALATFAGIAGGSSASAAPVFKLAHDSTLVVRGVVDEVQSYKDDAFLVFTITPRTVLKGPAAVGVPLRLVEERVFGSERPYFEKGAETLVFAVPLPPYSYYRQALPSAEYWKWTDRNDNAQQIAALADPEVAAAVQAYIAAERAPVTAAAELGALLASPVSRVRADALDAVEHHPEFAKALDRKALQPLVAFLADERVPIVERGATLVRLAHAHAPGTVALAEPLVAKPGALQAPALEALVALGHAPAEERLLGWSRSDDPALRLAALRGLARSRSRPALDRLAEVVTTEQVVDVRSTAIAALADNGDTNAIPVLASVLHGTDGRDILAATRGLARIGGADAVAALSQALREGSVETAMAAAFALKEMRRADADAILHEQRDAHPDPEVRRVIKLALGEKYEAHGE